MIKLDHLTLAVGDCHAAGDWYRSQLGLKTEFEIPERGVVALQDDAGFTVFFETAPKPSASCILYFQVDEVDAMHRDLTARGVRVVHGPRKEPWGYGIELEDPDGHRVRLWDERSMRAHDAR
jgi:predicted enzyme related to lactoylglutathione lyase